jgi:hypothetical protein
LGFFGGSSGGEEVGLKKRINTVMDDERMQEFRCSQDWWLTPVILATQETEIRKISV